MVIDDDASTRALLSHSLSELAKEVVDHQWPVDSNGKKTPKSKDVGKLPFEHTIIKFLADLMHRIRCFGKHAFGLAMAPASASSLTMVDACRLKRNFGCWLLSHHTKDFDTFQEKSKAAVEHHFNNHAHCDEWCNMKKADATEASKGDLKCRCKKENKKTCEDVSQILCRFTETEKLKECHHGHGSQKNESMNQHVTRHVPKDRTCCQSTSQTGRICIAVGVDSVGHEEHCHRVFEKMKTPLPDSTRTMLRKMKKKRDYDRWHQAQPKRKRTRSEKKFAKLKDGMAKQMADKAMGHAHGSGMNMAGEEDSTNKTKKKVVSFVRSRGTQRTERRPANIMVGPLSKCKLKW
jgi:hypothetical protein